MSTAQGVALPGRYRLVSHLATGGMGSVWRGRDLRLQRDVAIKLLAERFLGDDAAVRRFQREARTAARLSGHPNVVTIFDVGAGPPGEDGLGRPFIVMEHLAGGTVADALRLGAVSRAEAINWVAQAASALDHAHRRGVVHRDVKLSNLLLDLDRVVHVGDFGIARLAGDDTLTEGHAVIGTAAYLAPERVLGQPATDASDRYALAVAAFELLVGARPFTAGHFAAQAQQHLEEPPPRASRRNPALPRALDEVLARGMAKRPEDRWPTAGAFAQALGDAAAEARRGRRATRVPPAPARRRPGPAEPARAPSGGPPARLLAAFALAAALVSLALALAAGGSGGAAQRAAHARAAHRSAGGRSVSLARRPAQPSSPAPPTLSPDTLEARGHELMLADLYQRAIPVLRQAVAAAPRDSLTYAYALYDLGRSLLESGDPLDAIPILRRRLGIPNQTPVVAATLRAALRAAGQEVVGAQPQPGGGPRAARGDGGGAQQGDGGGD